MSFRLSSSKIENKLTIGLFVLVLSLVLIPVFTYLVEQNFLETTSDVYIYLMAIRSMAIAVVLVVFASIIESKVKRGLACFITGIYFLYILYDSVLACYILLR